MINNLSQHEKRTVLICVLAAAAIALYFLGIEPMQKDWHGLRNQLHAARMKINQIKMDPKAPEFVKLQGLMQQVPVVEMPRQSGLQGPLFQEKLNEQLKKAAIKSKSLSLVESRTAKNIAVPEYTIWTIQAQGRASLDQVLNLLDALPENPQYAGIQRMVLKVDPKKRNEVDWEITVFTYALK